MIVTDEITASVGGAELHVDAGQITLDTSRAPYVAATVDLGAVSQETLALLDPRTTPAPRVTITAAVTGSSTSSRTFDLHVRKRTVDVETSTCTLELASDEGLLSDYAPLADDSAPFPLASSLRSVVDYVLAEAVGSAALAPGIDANATPYWRATNYAKNPAARSSAVGYAAGTGTASIGRHTDITWNGLPTIRFSASGSGEAYLNTPTQASARPGQVWTYSYHLLSAGTQRPARTLIRFKDASGQLVAQYVSPAVTPSGDWIRVSGTAVAPPGTTTVEAFATTVSNATSQAHYTSGHMLTEGSALPAAARLLPWFDGATSLAGYTTQWDYALDTSASTSTRTPAVERTPDALIWRAGQTALEFLHPLLQANGLRLVCDETRTWTLRGEDYSIPGAVVLRQGINIVEADDATNRNAGFWFDARVTRYRWTDSAGVQQERIDSFALTPTYSRLSSIEVAAAYPGPGRSEYAVRRAQGVGRELNVETAADWRATPEQTVQVALDHAPSLIGSIVSVTFDVRTGRMTTTTRARDIPLGAIDLLVGTIDALTGTINSL